MKNAHPIEDKAGAPGTGAAILSQPGFPAKPNSVTAEVLSRLLRRERLTSLDGVSEASTTRLAAVVHYLETVYGWTIQRRDKATGCRDGRVAWVVEYSVSDEHIEAAMAAGAATWCASVRVARAERRVLAPWAYQQADKLNRKRAPIHNPAQGNLFGAGA